MLPKVKQLNCLRQIQKRVCKQIQSAGGNDAAHVALLEEACRLGNEQIKLLRQIHDDEFEAQQYLAAKPFFLRRVLNICDELAVLLNSSKEQVTASLLLRDLKLVCKSPDWLSEMVDFISETARELGPNPTPKQLAWLEWQVAETHRLFLKQLNPTRIETELGQLIFRMASKTKGASAEPFESLAKIWKRLNEHPFALFEPLAGARDTHLAVFELVRQARLPEKEDPNDPLAKVWASQEEFIKWLRQRGVEVSKAWLSGLLKGEGEKAWDTIDDVKRWMAKKLGIHNPPDPVLSEYYYKHNNALPSLSSLIGNAKGKKPKRGKS